MSQQKKANIIFAIVIIVIVSIAFGITFYFINKSNKNIEETNKEEVKSTYLTFREVSKSGTVDIYKKYPINPITINLEDKVSISGLKDKTIETKINNKLSKLKPDDDYKCFINFNASNVLSISCSVSDYATRETLSKNIDLTTGNEIKFEEIFNKNTKLNEIITKESHLYACSWNNCYPDNDYNVEEGESQEETIITFINYFKNDSLNFAINYDFITILNVDKDNDYYLNHWINYATYYPEITIYDRFLTEESIFEEEVKEHCLPQEVIDYTQEDDFFETSEFINNNNYLFLTVNNYSNSDLEDKEYEKYEFDLPKISEKIKNFVIKEYNLKEISNYKAIRVKVEIYYNTLNDFQLTCQIENNEYSKDSFTKALLNDALANPIKENYEYKANIIMDKNGHFKLLDEDIGKLYPNFENALYSYILDSINNEENKFSYYNIEACEVSDEIEKCLENRDFHKLIKEAGYAIDYEQKRIFMYHVIPDTHMPIILSHVKVFLPFSLFES